MVDRINRGQKDVVSYMIWAGQQQFTTTVITNNNWFNTLSALLLLRLMYNILANHDKGLPVLMCFHATHKCMK